MYVIADPACALVRCRLQAAMSLTVIARSGGEAKVESKDAKDASVIRDKRHPHALKAITNLHCSVICQRAHSALRDCSG